MEKNNEHTEDTLEIKIVCDNRDKDTINAAIAALKKQIKRFGDESCTIEDYNYVIEIS
jgi:hypothetical protein